MASPPPEPQESPPEPPEPSELLQFFVRTSSGTRVLRIPPTSTISSVLSLFPGGRDRRLVFSGRYLSPDSTLSSAGVSAASTLHLTSVLRSGNHAQMHQLAAAVAHAANASDLSVVSNVSEFLRFATSIPQPYSRWFSVFVNSEAPLAIVRFYARTGCNAAAHSLNCFASKEVLTKLGHAEISPLFFHFCLLLSSSVGKEDQLYLWCRRVLSSLVSAKGWNLSFIGLSCYRAIMVLQPFVLDISHAVIAKLSSQEMSVQTPQLVEFLAFSYAMQRLMASLMPGVIKVDVVRGSHSSCRTEGQDRLVCTVYDLYAKVFHAVRESLNRLQTDTAFLVNKKVGNDANWASDILSILTWVNTFSLMFEGEFQKLRSVLLEQRGSIRELVKRAVWNPQFYWLTRHKDIWEFDMRRDLVYKMFPKKDGFFDMHEMLIDRSNLLVESFESISEAAAQELHRGLFIEFKDEKATGPGVLGEWFFLVCRELFSQHNVLFLPCPNDQRRFFLNPASAVDPLHLKYLKFAGRVIGLALLHNVQVGLVFDRVFFLQLAGNKLCLQDIEEADPCFYASCKKILEMDEELIDSDALGLTFVLEVQQFGSSKITELCPGGGDIAVNSKNRALYVDLLLQNRFVNSVSVQLQHFAEGFGDILTDSNLQKVFFQSLELKDFDRMLGGSESAIDVREWESHTEYTGYKAKDLQICWFWKAVESMPAKEQRMLLFFWTSIKYLPTNGFQGLSSKLEIQKAGGSCERLPSSQTCFYCLNLPPYNSMETMQSRLQIITQEHICSSFGKG